MVVYGLQPGLASSQSYGHKTNIGRTNSDVHHADQAKGLHTLDHAKHELDGRTT